ncbi:MAG: hypothetical protein CVT99_13550 [Bacteroidetes bacterium HGW-Bacteroidetes-16]|jgi:hypothetical protein|nr:MAG: hypothetical protein CVT99_13550 [Bacteroidetes bacterium HGW-Bacteroidetes-16]
MLRSNCTSYLKNYEHIEGIEEKYKEVYKLFDSYKDYEPFDDIVNGAKAGNIEDIVSLGRAYKLVSNTCHWHAFYQRVPLPVSTTIFSNFKQNIAWLVVFNQPQFVDLQIVVLMARETFARQR